MEERTKSMKTLKVIQLAGQEVGLEYLNGMVEGTPKTIRKRLSYLKKRDLIKKRLEPQSKTFPPKKRLFVSITKRGEYVLSKKENGGY